MIAVIDYGAGNLQSVIKAFEFIGCKVRVINDPEKLKKADAAVLPGVGSFGDAMDSLRARGFVEPIREFIRTGKPFLGICLGLQLLFDSSEESPGVEGLGILKGKVLRIPDAPGLKIPHIGWNSLDFHGNCRLMTQGLGDHPYVYFVHSYYLKADDPHIVTATAEYGVTIHAAVQKGSLFACQFHPEKSGADGLQMLRNFAALVPGEGRREK
ncbi:MAG TPA: imidazole glycerol phosphate synthase subunit HisH [Candidatus Gallacutalibacter pullistercoris]|nr:imidazole glycerol phosphate synthase subunit HisH [Candidatus Gallacutalibacter pullistercoris]